MNALSDCLAETVRGVKTPREFGYALSDFVDRFNHAPDSRLVADEPASLTGRFADEGLADAYLASAAAWLCRTHQLPVPLWARGAARALEHPWFAAKTPKLKTLLLQDSPAEFRVRNLFVSADALVRV